MTDPFVKFRTNIFDLMIEEEYLKIRKKVIEQSAEYIIETFKPLNEYYEKITRNVPTLREKESE